MASLYQSQSRDADAISLTERALAYLSKALKPDDTELATEIDNLAFYYHRVGRDADAEPSYKRALAIREKTSRRRATGSDGALRSLALVEKGGLPDDRSLPPLLIDMAVLYGKQSRYAEAEAFYKRALAISEKSLGRAIPMRHTR